MRNEIIMLLPWSIDDALANKLCSLKVERSIRTVYIIDTKFLEDIGMPYPEPNELSTSFSRPMIQTLGFDRVIIISTKEDVKDIDLKALLLLLIRPGLSISSKHLQKYFKGLSLETEIIELDAKLSSILSSN